MRKRDIVLAGLVAAAVLYAVMLVGGCDFVLTNTNEQSQQTGSGSPTEPEPIPTDDPADVETVRVGEFGREGCPAGETLPVGCKVVLTCTPKDADGNDLGLSNVPRWSVSGPGSITPTSSNPYNARGECDSSPGTVLFSCEVAGVEGSKGYECAP